MPKHVSEAHAIRWIPVAECGLIWPDAQRHVMHESTVNTIVNEFDPDRLGIICVAEKNGHAVYHIIDGRHRHEALNRMGYGDQLVRAEVLDVRNSKDAARIFRGRNTRQAVSALDQFRTGVEAGFELETNINTIVRANGYRIGQSDHPRAIAGVGAIKEVFRKFGGDVLALTLQTIAVTWRDDANAVNAVILRGVGYMIGTYGDAVDYKRFREKLSKKTPGNLMGAMKQQKDILGSNLTTAAVYVLVSQYNSGLRNADDKLTPPS